MKLFTECMGQLELALLQITVKVPSLQEKLSFSSINIQFLKKYASSDLEKL